MHPEILDLVKNSVVQQWLSEVYNPRNKTDWINTDVFFIAEDNKDSIHLAIHFITGRSIDCDFLCDDLEYDPVISLNNDLAWMSGGLYNLLCEGKTEISLKEVSAWWFNKQKQNRASKKNKPYTI